MDTALSLGVALIALTICICLVVGVLRGNRIQVRLGPLRISIGGR